MSDAVLGGSFRDPSGFVFTRDGVLYRQVNHAFRDNYDALMGSRLYAALVDAGLLVAHEEVDVELAPQPGAYRVLRPEPVPFVSYPYEWCPGQLRDAALATLRVQEVALGHGMCLRDASAFNVQFRQGRPVHIDTLSFERLREGRPWAAYRQFCEQFLAPLAVTTRVDVRLHRLLRADVAGIPLDLAAGLLPASTRFRPGLLTHVHLHVAAQRRYSARAGRPTGDEAGGFSLKAHHGLVDSLHGTVDHLRWEPGRSTWSEYYEEASHYTQAAMDAKEKVVGEVLDRVRPAAVWDLGANTGRFSRLAAERGAVTVAFDADAATVEAAWREIRGDSGASPAGGDLLPLVVDLANPTPRLGWAHEERMSLADRGPVDAVLALALVHHLAIGNNVPLARIAAFFARLCRHLVVEFAPRGDPRVEQLLAGREDVFADYSSESFEAAFGRLFTVEARQPLPDSHRVVYHLRVRP